MNHKYLVGASFLLLFVAGHLVSSFRNHDGAEDYSSEARQSATRPYPVTGSRFSKVLLAPDETPRPLIVTGRKEVINDEGDLVYADFVLDPFKITQSTKYHSWTEVNISGPAEIDQIVHNDFERERVMEESSFMDARQLVYRKISFQDLIEKQLDGGEKVETVILPGLDGAEYEVVIDDWEAKPASADEREGGFSGHLKGDPDSTVRWSYYEGVETGAINSEAQNIDLAFDPREEGQLVVKAINREALEGYRSLVLDSPTCNVKFSQLDIGDPSVNFSQPEDE